VAGIQLFGGVPPDLQLNVYVRFCNIGVRERTDIEVILGGYKGCYLFGTELRRWKYAVWLVWHFFGLLVDV